MENVMEVVSLLNDEDKKKVLELANILLKQNKYNKLRKEIEARRNEVKKGEVLSHEEIWRDNNGEKIGFACRGKAFAGEGFS